MKTTSKEEEFSLHADPNMVWSAFSKDSTCICRHCQCFETDGKGHENCTELGNVEGWTWDDIEEVQRTNECVLHVEQ